MLFFLRGSAALPLKLKRVYSVYYLPAVFVYGKKECPYDAAQYMCIYLPRGLHSLSNSTHKAVRERVLQPWPSNTQWYSGGGCPPTAPLQASQCLRPYQKPSHTRWRMDQARQGHSDAWDGGIIGLLVLPETPNTTWVLILMTPKLWQHHDRSLSIEPRSEAPQPLTTAAVWENVLEMKEHPLMESATESQHALAYNVAEDKVWQRRQTAACCRPAAKRRMWMDGGLAHLQCVVVSRVGRTPGLHSLIHLPLPQSTLCLSHTHARTQTWHVLCTTVM